VVAGITLVRALWLLLLLLLLCCCATSLHLAEPQSSLPWQAVENLLEAASWHKSALILWAFFFRQCTDVTVVCVPRMARAHCGSHGLLL
jgi:ABC-type antimicrobial peptide transport system permease subunit